QSKIQNLLVSDARSCYFNRACLALYNTAPALHRAHQDKRALRLNEHRALCLAKPAQARQPREAKQGGNSEGKLYQHEYYPKETIVARQVQAGREEYQFQDGYYQDIQQN